MAQVQSLVRELRSSQLFDSAKKKKKKICKLFDHEIPVTEIHPNKTQRSGDAIDVHCNTVYKRKHLETTYMSAIRSWLGRLLNLVYGILFSYWDCVWRKLSHMR